MAELKFTTKNTKNTKKTNLCVLCVLCGEFPGPSWLLTDLYAAACGTPSDINEHCPVLSGLARECRHVTEMGTRTGVSTTALLFVQPERLVCYDLCKEPRVDLLRAVAGRTEFIFHEADVRAVHRAA